MPGGTIFTVGKGRYEISLLHNWRCVYLPGSDLFIFSLVCIRLGHSGHGRDHGYDRQKGADIMSQTMLPGLFGAPPVKRGDGMVRSADHETSVQAAQVVKAGLSTLQGLVMAAFKRISSMTDGELEDLPEFRHFAYSTVRKRRTELYQKGLLFKTDERKTEGRSNMAVWAVTIKPKG